jgi:hypothetical protein
MFDSQAPTLGKVRHRTAVRSGGATGNARLTGPSPSPSPSPSSSSSPPVALKLASTGTGVALLVAGPPGQTLIFAHKLTSSPGAD